MRFFLNRIFFIAAVIIPLAQAALSAQQADTGNEIYTDRIVISAAKTDITAYETGASVTVITEKEIEKSGKTVIADLLKGVPGLAVSQNGSLGGQTSVNFRGSKSENTLVLIDGIRVNDPMGIGRGFDYADLRTLNVERIEIIRGAQNTLYGSDASAGVINIITRKGEGEPRINATAEAGSYGTFSESVTLSGSSDVSDFSFGVSRMDSKGFSKSEKAPDAAAEPDRDCYKNTSISSRLGFRLPYKAHLDASYSFNDSETDLDSGGYDDALKYKSYKRLMSTGVKLKQEILPWWNHSLSLGYSSTIRKIRDKPDVRKPYVFDNTWFEGIFRNCDWQNNFSILKADTVTAGIDYTDETGSSVSYIDSGFGATNDSFDETRSYNTGIYFQNHLKLFEIFYNTIGFRADDHNLAGRKASYQCAASVRIPFAGTRIKCTYGTGFKAPSLYQLYAPASAYGPIGNEDLKSEESVSYDAGVEQPVLGDTIKIEATYFKTSYRNLIDFQTGAGFVNIGRTVSSGYETSLTVSLPFDLRISANYTYTESEDRDTGKKLPRIPGHKISCAAGWDAPGGAAVNISGNYTGKRDDVWYDSSWVKHEVEMEPYFTADIFLSYQINSYMQLFGRCENITDRKYQATAGYKSPERSFYGGVKGTF